MSGLMSKRKGARGERELAHLLTDYGIPTRRGQQFKGTPDSPDVAIEGHPEWHIEVKRAERFSPYAALEQAEDDIKSSLFKTVVAVFHKANKKPWIVVLYASDFAPMLRARIRE